MFDFDILDPQLWASGAPERNGMPYEQLSELREKAPCHRQVLTDERSIPWTWVVSRYNDVMQVSRDTGIFRSGQGISLKAFSVFDKGRGGFPSMITMDGEEHKRNRQVVAKAITPGVVKTLEGHIREITDEALAKALTGTPVEFVDLVSAPVPLDVISDLFGVPPEDRSKISEWVNTYVLANDPDYALDHEQVMAAVNSLIAYALDIVEKRRIAPADDMMSRVAQSFDRGELTEDEVIGMVFVLIFAGNETTRNAMSHGVHALIRNPDQMALLREDFEGHAQTAVEEIVRYATPIIHFRRTAAAPFELRGQNIAVGDPVTILYAAANFDESAFADPTRFDITRTPNRHLGFGIGPHTCLGAGIARLEIKCLLELLVERTRDIKLCGPVAYARDNTVRAVKSLPIEMRIA